MKIDLCIKQKIVNCFYPAWKKVAECVYSMHEFPRPSIFKNDTYVDDYDKVDQGCREEDGDGNSGACFERFATKGLYIKIRHIIVQKLYFT